VVAGFGLRLRLVVAMGLERPPSSGGALIVPM
jgi:hypothetical protein